VLTQESTNRSDRLLGGYSYFPIPIRLYFLSLSFTAMNALGQLVSAPEPQVAIITSIVKDADVAGMPGAIITVDGPVPVDHRFAVVNGTAFFTLLDVRSTVTLHLTVTVQGLSDWISHEMALSPGQSFDLRHRTCRKPRRGFCQRSRFRTACD
jgi:hypothetical protein